MKNVAVFFVAILAIRLEPANALFASEQFKLLEVRLGDQRIQGRILSHKDEVCWLLHRDGRLQQFAVDKVTDFSERSEYFRAHSQLEIKKQLQSEFGKDFEVRTTAHYVVAARRGTAEAYAAMFERIYFEFIRSFRGRGLHVVEAEFPLVAVVFPDEAKFIKYCQDEKTRIQPGLLGFYVPSSNRVAMYERPNVDTLDHTVIHEATHQVAFNTGVHSRLAKHPLWVVEGLATMFEADGIRSRAGTSKPVDRINRERFLWFMEYSGTRRKTHSLRAFLSDDTLFEKSTLDAYSEAWALSFYLMELHPSEYSRFLKRLVDRDPLSPYDAESRVKDFTDVFGSDLDRFETSYLKFIRTISKR